MRRFLLLSVLVLAILLISVEVRSVLADTFGGKWSTASTSYHSYSRYGTDIGTARSAWNGNTEFYLYEVPAYSESVSIQDVWSGDSWAGAVYLYPSQWTTPYQSGSIHFNYRIMDVYGSNARTSTALHEFGHIIGLAHAPTSETSCMHERNYLWLTTPASYDINDVNGLY